MTVVSQATVPEGCNQLEQGFGSQDSWVLFWLGDKEYLVVRTST